MERGVSRAVGIEFFKAKEDRHAQIFEKRAPI